MSDEVRVIVVAETQIEPVSVGEPHIVTVEGRGAQGVVGPAGPQGPPGTAPHIPFVQSSPASTWTITHTLATFPNVVVVLDGVGPVVPDVQYPDVETVVLEFPSPQSGTAVLS